MLSLLKNKAWFRGSNAIGLHVQLSSNTNQYFLCHLKAEKDGVKPQDFATVSELNIKLVEAYKDYPLYLTLDGKGVMHLEVSNQEEPLDALNRILPNAQPKDFYLQERKIDKKRWMSLIRKDTLKTVFEELEKFNIKPISLVLGAFPLENFSLYSGKDEKEFSFQLFDREWFFELAELHKLAKIPLKETYSDIDINAETCVNEAYILPFTNVLRFFVRDASYGESKNEFVKENEQSFFHQRLFKIGGWASLSFFFIVLLGNFFLFSHYQGKVQLLESELLQKEQSIDRLVQLEEEVNQKQVFLKETGLIDRAKLSFKVDRIAADLPSSIQLSKLAVNPIKKADYQHNESPEFLLNEIRLEGYVSQSVELNDWIKGLKEKEWINAVEIEAYDFEKKKKRAMFTVLISTR